MKIDYSLIKIIPANKSHYEFVYRVKKEAYGEYITRIYGWEENKQRKFFADDWAKQTPNVILYGNEPIGTICFYKKEGPIFSGRFFIEHFFILPEYHNKGIGSYVLKQFIDIADSAGLPINLMVLTINPAISLYTRMGFKIIDTRKPVILTERKPGGNEKIDFTKIRLVDADETFYDFLFRLKKAAMGPYVKQVWGWDDQHQLERHAEDWQEKRPRIILYDSQPIGSILIKREKNSLHIGRFYILPEYQNKGIGTHLLKDTLKKADKAGKPTTLAVLRVNPAISLYKRHGFTVTGTNEYQYLMERKPGGKTIEYQAVIFDLGGTLSRSAAWAEYRDAAIKMAVILKAPPEEYIEQWFANSEGLGKGVFKTWTEYIKHVCNIMELNVTESQLKKAAEIPLAVTRNQICNPREGALELLSYLRTKGYKIGLISDCYYDVPQIWPETPFAPYFDATVFSCEAGMNKADPRIFKIALKKMAAKPEKCLYIADGMRNELANAAGLGMRAIQLNIPGEIYDSPIREDWHGPVISSLHEILNLL